MSSADVNSLIDMLYEKIEDARSPALKPNMSMVDRDEMLELLDELRSQLPVEIKRAQELLAAREKFVEDAKRDVDRRGRHPPDVSGVQRGDRGRPGPDGGGHPDGPGRGEAVPHPVPLHLRRQAPGAAGQTPGGTGRQDQWEI